MLLLITGASLKASDFKKNDSLSHYMNEAALYNPSILQKLEVYQAALQKVQQAGSLSDPELSAGVFLSPMELMAGNQVADIQLMQMFPWFGVLRNAKNEMSFMAKASYESFREVRSQVLFDLQKTWYDLLRIKQEIGISEKNADILRTIEKLMIVKFRAGGTGISYTEPAGSGMTQNSVPASSQSGMQSMGGGSTANIAASVPMKSSNSMSSGSVGIGLAGLYLVQIDIGNLENEIVLLKSRFKTTLTRFNGFLNRSASSQVTIPEDFKLDSLDINIEEFAESNPMLAMLAFDQKALEAREKMVKQMSFPMVGLGLDYSIINKSDMSTSPMNGKDMLMPMLKVTLPVYRRKYKAMRTEIVHLKNASGQAFTSALNNLRTDYFEARQLLDDAKRRLSLYESQSGLAKKSLDIMIKSFSSNLAGLSDILQVRQQLLDYETKRTEAFYDYNISIAWLNKINSKY